MQYATSAGTASAGADYKAASGTLVFGHNVTSEFVVAIRNDSTSRVWKPSSFRNPSAGVAIGTPRARLRIQDDDGQAVYFEEVRTEAVEGGAPVIRVERSGSLARSATVTVKERRCVGHGRRRLYGGQQEADLPGGRRVRKRARFSARGRACGGRRDLLLSAPPESGRGCSGHAEER